MEATKTISNETLERVKTLPRIDYKMYLELINQGQVKRVVKLTKERTIFFENNNFLYLNPFHKHLQICGTFTESEVCDE